LGLVFPLISPILKLTLGAENTITAYDVAVPEKQEQNLPGLDKKIKPGVEHSKVEVWDHDGKPSLIEYVGSEK
jgi:hypothetical protein